MSTKIHQENYVYFLHESEDLLRTIETELLNLREQRTQAKVYGLMRATHTLKGAAAIVEQKTIQNLAHYLENVFQALLDPTLEVDAELETLLFQGYECMRLALAAEIRGDTYNLDDIQNRGAEIFSQIQQKLGDALGKENMIPSSAELGFDIVKSVFEVGVKDKLANLTTVWEAGNPQKVVSTCLATAEIFVGLGESLSLPGFQAIATTLTQALQAHPSQTMTIVKVALGDLQQGYEAVIGGDRTQGGSPSPQLLELAKTGRITGKTATNSSASSPISSPTSPASSPQNVNRTNPATSSQGVARTPANSSQTGIKPAQTAQPTAQSTSQPVNQSISPSTNQPVARFSYEKATPTTAQQNPQSKAQPVIKPASQPVAKAIPKTTPQKIPTPISEASVKPVSNEFNQSDLENDQDYYPNPYADSIDPPLNAQSLNQPPAQSLNQSPHQSPPLDKTSFTSPEVNPEEAALVEVFGSLDISDHLLSEISLSLPDDLTEDLTEDSRETLTENLALLETQELAPPEPPEILNPEPRNFERPQTNLSLRVELEHLEHQNYLAGELLINQNQLTLQGEQVEETVQKLFGWLQQHRQTIGKLKKHLNQQQGLGIPEVTDLMDTVLEETVQLEQATADLNLFSQNGQQFVEREQRLLKQVRESMQQIRMMPVGNVLNRLALITQQLTNAYNKPVEIKLRGLDVLIDKAIAESLYEALLHLVRNAFAHGIESLEVRRQHQKPEVGTIEVSAYNQGNRTVIEVRDDGAGLDVDRIVTTAISQKLLTPVQGDHLKNLPQPEPQILDLLCSPGMSTKDDVNDLAGRGIGLNVVRSQLQHIRGNLFLQSQRHQGTTFSLQIKGSLMSARLLSCRSGGRIYTFVANEITQTLMPFAEQIKSVGEQKILDWHDGTKSVSVPLYNLSELFEYADPKPPTTDVEAPELTPLLTPRQGRVPVLLLPKGSGFVGLEVDQVIEEQELVIKPIPAAIPSPEYIYGCTVLADGSMTLVIDGVELIDYASARISDHTSADRRSKLWGGNSGELAMLQGRGYNEESTTPTNGKNLSYGAGVATEQFDRLNVRPSDRGDRELPQLPQAKAPVKTTILIVDDSITERQKLSLVLQKSGFQVQQAKDGVEALDQLQKNLAIPLIICDLEMPRMTGFEFLSVTRQQPPLAKIPVIMLTSRSSAQYQQIARSLGAIAYFTKPYLDYQLLAKVKEILASQ